MLKSFSLITAIVVGLAGSVATAETTGTDKNVTAEIVAVTGKVLLNRGEGFVAAPALTPLAVGDQLMVGSESSAELVYGAAGCTLNVSAGSLVRIAAEPPCKKGESIALAGQTLITPAFFSGSNDNIRFLALAPIVLVTALVVVIASTYDEPEPASAP